MLTTLVLGLAVIALPSATARASETPPQATSTEAVAAPSPVEAPAQPTTQTTQATTTTAPSAPEVVKQRTQPSSGGAAGARRTLSAGTPHGAHPSGGAGPVAGAGAPKSTGGAFGPKGTGGAFGPSGAGTAGSSHPLALAPGSLTPPLPPALAGSLGGVPSFFVNAFSIPPFLLPIYQAAGAAYGIPWQVLAAINEVETDYGRDLSVSSAGAEGWMQFLPAEWVQFGVDVNNDGFEDPYNPADAIFAAARYLADAGGQRDIRAAVFAYNHSQAYVRSVMLRARLLAGTPPQLLGAITGLSEARFPVYAPSHYSDGFSTTPGGRTLVGTTIYSQPGAPAIAVQDGRIARIGSAPQLGRYISLTDSYGNTYTYAQLGTLASVYPVLEGVRRFSLHPLRVGVHVISGTVLGHVSSAYAAEPHMLFQIRPAGAGAPLIDPKPVLDGWVKLQDSSAIHARGAGPLRHRGPTPGQALLESKAQLERQIAREHRIRIAACERRAIAGGRVDRRVLAVLQFLDSSGFAPSVSAASCASKPPSGAQRRALGHRPPPAGALGGPPVAPGEESGATTIDVGAINGAAVSGARGQTSPDALAAVRRLLSLQGTLRPDDISGPPGLPKRANVTVRAGEDRIQIAFDTSRTQAARVASVLFSGLSPLQWVRLIARLGQIPDPTVQSRPSPGAIPDAPLAGSAASMGGRR